MYTKVYLKSLKNASKYLANKQRYNLENKYEDLIEKYRKTLKERGYTNLDEEVDDLKNFIEKMAVWYELKFSDPVTVKLFQCENLELDNSLFNYSGEDPIYNTHTFINRYLRNEKYFLTRPKYKDIVDLSGSQHFHLTRKGKITSAEYLSSKSTKLPINCRDIFEGVHIANAKFVAEIEGIDLKDPNNNIDKAVNSYKNRIKAKEILLDAVMYKIIMRGGNKIGPLRAMLFAKEFNRDINIPMKYAISSSIDKDNKNLILNYLKNGGNRNIEIFINYFYKGIDPILVDYVSLDEFIKKEYKEDIDFYTKEELEEYKKDLYQRMVNSLNNRKLTLNLENKDTDK